MRKRNQFSLIALLLAGAISFWPGAVGASDAQLAEATFYVS